MILEFKVDPCAVLAEYNGIAAIHKIAAIDDPMIAANIMKIVLENGGNPNIKDANGITPLHIAISKKNEIVAKMLLVRKNLL